MIGLLILAEKNLGTGLIATVVHTLGSRPPQLEATELDHSAPPENIEGLLRQGLQKVDDGDGVLILADVYGATHTNIACRLLVRGRIELITGVKEAVKKAFAKHSKESVVEDDLLRASIRNGVGEFVAQKTQRRPMVLPVIVRV